MAGDDASNHKTKYDSGELSTLAIILIAIAGAVGLLLLTMACCCVSTIIIFSYENRENRILTKRRARFLENTCIVQIIPKKCIVQTSEKGSGGREVGRERGREGGREGGRERGREGGREGWEGETGWGVR